jgi:hypothetical protein
VRSLGTYVVDWRPLAIPAFRWLWVGSVISAVGGSFSLIAVPAQLSSSGSPRACGSPSLPSPSAARPTSCSVPSATRSPRRTQTTRCGRIQGSLTVVLVGGPQLANLLHGVGGAALGPRVAICAGGLLTAAAVALIVRAVPALWLYAAPASAPDRPDTSRPGA